MGKQKQATQTARYAVNKQHARLAQERAAQEQSKQEKRRENAEKSRRMGNAFLLIVVSLIGLFCLYTLLRTFLFRPGSLSELHDSLLFVSVVALPYLLAAAALLIRRLNAKRRETCSERTRRFSAALLAAVFVAAFALFGFQMLNGPQNADKLPAYVQTVEALEQSGLPVTAPEQPQGMRTLLEYSLVEKLTCGSTKVTLHYHADNTHWIMNLFQAQVALDYADFPLTEAVAAKVWRPVEADGTARAAVAFQSNEGVRIVELSGPKAELEALLPLHANNEEEGRTK